MNCDISNFILVIMIVAIETHLGNVKLGVSIHWTGLLDWNTGLDLIYYKEQFSRETWNIISAPPHESLPLISHRPLHDM